MSDEEQEAPDEQATPKPSQAPINRKPVFIAIALVLASYPLWSDSGQKSTEIPQSIEDTSFPTGPASLVDSGAGTDKLRALTENYVEESSERAVARPKRSDEAESEEAAAEEENEQAEETASPVPEALISAGPLTLALTGVTEGIRFATDSSNGLWIAHRYGLVTFPNSNLKKAKVTLSRGVYDREFNDSLGPITAMTTGKDKSVWLGLANGQLMRYLRYEWQILATPSDNIKASISSLIEDKGNLYVASRGLYRWDESFRRAVLEPTFKKKRIFTAHRARDGVLFLGGRSGLWQQIVKPDETKSWKRLWKPSKEDSAVYAIAETEDSSFLLATNNGIARVSRAGVVEDRVLAGKRVTAITKNTGSPGYWVGTRASGLRFWDGHDWYHVDAEDGLSNWVSAIHIDSKDRLWIAAEGKGPYISKRADAQRWILKKREETRSGFQPQAFADACDAADTIIPGVSVSDDIAVESLDGRGIVFVRGVQQCPRGVGYRRKDGTVVILDGWNAIVYLANARQQLAIPEEIPADKATRILLDSKNRLWLGTEELGIYRIDAGKKWFSFGRNVGLGDSRVSSMLEDADGRIWIGTVPPLDKEEKAFHDSNLHLYTDDSWYHFDPRNGLAQISTHGLSMSRKKDLLVGTHGGFSVIDPQGNVTSYGPKQGLKTYFVKSIAEDRNGRIWLGHQYYGNGVSWFDGEKFYRTDKTHGLFNERIEVVAHDRARRIWLISSNGRVGVYPFSFFENNNVSSTLKKKAVRTRNLID